MPAAIEYLVERVVDFVVVMRPQASVRERVHPRVHCRGHEPRAHGFKQIVNVAHIFLILGVDSVDRLKRRGGF